MGHESSIEEILVSTIDGLRDELVATVAAAIRIPSVTPNYPGEDPTAHRGRESEVSQLLANLYRRSGCEVDLFAIEPGRENCVGVLHGTGGGRSLLYNGHVDVVPGGPAEAWDDGNPWSGRVESGRIWGRGAADMKAGLVAQAFAALALRESGIVLRGDLILEAVVGEEMMEHALGTTACVERGYRADAAVVAEPSAPPVPLAVVPVTPGILGLKVTVVGKATHPAMRGETIHAGGGGTEIGVNAIDKAFLVYEAIRRREEEWALTKRHPLFAPGQFVIHPGVFVGSPAGSLQPFVVPDVATIDYVVIYHPDEDPDAVRAEIEDLVAGIAKLDGWLREHPPTIDWNHHWPQSVLDPDHPVVRATCDAHERAAGRAPVVRGWTAVEDTTFLNAAGIPAISYGPGDVRVAHAANEHVSIDEVVTATRTYALLAASWCGID